jgi:hypothetical protein
MLGDIFELLVNYYAECGHEKDPTAHWAHLIFYFIFISSPVVCIFGHELNLSYSCHVIHYTSASKVTFFCGKASKVTLGEQRLIIFNGC